MNQRQIFFIINIIVFFPCYSMPMLKLKKFTEAFATLITWIDNELEKPIGTWQFQKPEFLQAELSIVSLHDEIPVLQIHQTSPNNTNPAEQMEQQSEGNDSPIKPITPITKLPSDFSLEENAEKTDSPFSQTLNPVPKTESQEKFDREWVIIPADNILEK